MQQTPGGERTPEQRRQSFRDIARWVADSGASGALFNVAARLPLARVAEAHKHVEAGTKIGHVIVDL